MKKSVLLQFTSACVLRITRCTCFSSLLVCLSKKALLCLLNSCHTEFTSGVSKHSSSMIQSTFWTQSWAKTHTISTMLIWICSTSSSRGLVFLRQTSAALHGKHVYSSSSRPSAADTVYFRAKQNILAQSVLISADAFPPLSAMISKRAGNKQRALISSTGLTHTFSTSRKWLGRTLLIVVLCLHNLSIIITVCFSNYSIYYDLRCDLVGSFH